MLLFSENISDFNGNIGSKLTNGFLAELSNQVATKMSHEAAGSIAESESSYNALPLMITDKWLWLNRNNSQSDGTVEYTDCIFWVSWIEH